MNEQALSPAWLTVIIAAAFLAAFPLMWCAVVWLLSLLGGWSRLAKIYAARDKPVTGKKFSAVTGMVGGISYRGVLTIHVNDEGFFMEPMFLFRIAQPRLFIPWCEISARKPFTLLWWQADRLIIGQPKVGSITLPRSVVGAYPTIA